MESKKTQSPKRNLNAREDTKQRTPEGTFTITRTISKSDLMCGQITTNPMLDAYLPQFLFPDAPCTTFNKTFQGPLRDKAEAEEIKQALKLNSDKEELWKISHQEFKIIQIITVRDTMETVDDVQE